MGRKHLWAITYHDGNHVIRFDMHFNEIILKSTDNATELAIIPELLSKAACQLATPHVFFGSTAHQTKLPRPNTA